MNIFESHIKKILAKHLSKEEISLEVPKAEMGDYAFPCFTLSKEMKKAPQQIAQDIASHIKPDAYIKEVKALGPYVNFFINTDKLGALVLGAIEGDKESYGSRSLGKGKKLLIEHTSINPNASPHVGRARNALIGDAIVRLLRFQDYTVDVHYFVNDVGKQIAMLVLASEGKEKVTFDGLLEMYIDINKQSEENPEIEKKSFELLKRLEDGDKEVRKQFHDIVKTCVDGQQKILGELDIRYDHFDYESEFLWNKKTEDALKLLEKTGKLFIDGHGRFVMDLKGYGLGMEVPVMVVTRADKTSLYALRDIAYTIEKMKKGDNILILGEDQKLYFEQMDAVLKELRVPSPRVVHYSFVLLKDGKMSTRQGNVVLLSDFMEQVVKKANEEIAKRHGSTNEEAAKIIGYGALKHSMLKVSAEKSVTFDLETALSFEGDTGPYIQYSYARISSILRKHAKNVGKYDAGLLREASEIALIKKLGHFPDVCEKATHDLSPHLIATYLIELAQGFNEFYHQHDILQSEEHLRNARLAICISTAQVIKNGLSLLGIGVLEKM